MEIEAKFLIDSETDAIKCRELLGQKVGESQQENHFFDGMGEQLLKRNCMLRIRIEPGRETAHVQIKQHTEFMEGTSSRFTTEGEISAELVREAIKDPVHLAQVKDGPLPELLKTYGIGPKELKYLGGFRTSREEFRHDFKAGEAMTVKLDTVTYPFATSHELEVVCGKVPVHDIVDELDALLTKSDIAHKTGQRSKFGTFLEGCRENFCSSTLPLVKAP